jgi:enoyl-CoA hydratase/carnithine racemase
MSAQVNCQHGRMTQFETLRVDVDGRIGRLTLAQPEQLNPLGTVPLAELAKAATWFDTTDATVVVVSGEGRAFSSGFDLREFGGGNAAKSGPESRMSSREQGDLGRLMADAMEGMRAITIAAIAGPCVGGGLVLAAACDLRIAADDARFMLPEVDLGIPLAWGGIPRLLRELPPAIVREMVLTCRAFDAEEARSLGFVNRVVPRVDLEAAADELAASLAVKAPSVLRATKRHVQATLENIASTAGSWADTDQLGAALADPEARAAARAYMESRS